MKPLASEPIWEAVRHRFVTEHGGSWQTDSQRWIMGMSTPEWAAYLSTDLGVQLASCAAVEDSSNGLRAAAAAGMGVIAIPNAHYPPDAAALIDADLLLNNLKELTVEAVEDI